MDVHVPQAITDQLRRRGVDVTTARDDEHAEAPDEVLLDRAHQLGRLVFTQDIRFKALAEAWQREDRPFAGLVFGSRDLELIAHVSEPTEWVGTVVYLPF